MNQTQHTEVQSSENATVQSSEAMRVGLLLALTGGFLDAYTYLVRGHVFANAQTGNIVMMGVDIAQGNWWGVGRYLLPVLAFVAGVLLAETIRAHGKAQGILAVLGKHDAVIGAQGLAQHAEVLRRVIHQQHGAAQGGQNVAAHVSCRFAAGRSAPG